MNKLFLYFFLLLVSANYCRADIFVSEFMAANDSTLVDGDGNYSDWIELYNSSSNPVDITGYYLTDNTNTLIKWQFPSTNIPGRGFLIVFASGQTVDNYVDSLGYFHTTFKLSKNDAGENEDVALVLTNGVTITHAYLNYPEQYDDISYGMAWDSSTTNLISAGQDVTAHIPTTSVAGWTNIVYDDSGWLTGQTGVGYDNETDYDHLINLDVSAMRNVNASFYTRIIFEVSDPTYFDTLTLKMKYDDGFAAYINGVPGKSVNAPEPPLYNSQATFSHEANTVIYESFDVSSVIPSLQAGTNVLAVQGLNRPVGSSDILILPELVAGTAGSINTNFPVYLPAR